MDSRISICCVIHVDASAVSSPGSDKSHRGISMHVDIMNVRVNVVLARSFGSMPGNARPRRVVM